MYLSKGLTFNRISEILKVKTLSDVKFDLGFFFLIEIKLWVFWCLFFFFFFFFLRKSGSLQRAGCNFMFRFLHFKAIQGYWADGFMPNHEYQSSLTLWNLAAFCFGFQMNINMIYIGTNIVMHHVTKPSSAMALILLTL